MRVGEQYQAALPYRWCFKTLIRLPLVGTFPGGEGFGACVPARCCTQTSDTNYARPARIFAEQKCLAADECRQICCSAERSLDILQTSKALHTRKRVLPKYVGGARLVRHYKSGTPRISKGPRPFCFRKSPEKNLLKGFLWATSSRRLDTALLCVAKKRGVEKEPAGRFLPEVNHLTFPPYGVRIKQKRSFYYECIVQRQL